MSFIARRALGAAILRLCSLFFSVLVLKLCGKEMVTVWTFFIRSPAQYQLHLINTRSWNAWQPSVLLMMDFWLFSRGRHPLPASHLSALPSLHGHRPHRDHREGALPGHFPSDAAASLVSVLVCAFVVYTFPQYFDWNTGMMFWRCSPLPTPFRC